MKILLKIAALAAVAALAAGCCSCRSYQKKNRRPLIGACNRIMGRYEATEKGALKIGPLASTMMVCPGMEQEDAFTKALESTTHYDMDGPMLLLLSNGELRAVFQAKP